MFGGRKTGRERHQEAVLAEFQETQAARDNAYALLTETQKLVELADEKHATAKARLANVAREVI
jgi:hypothetical protein